MPCSSTLRAVTFLVPCSKATSAVSSTNWHTSSYQFTLPEGFLHLVNSHRPAQPECREPCAVWTTFLITVPPLPGSIILMSSCIPLSLLSGTKPQNTAHTDRSRDVLANVLFFLTLVSSCHWSCKHWLEQVNTFWLSFMECIPDSRFSENLNGTMVTSFLSYRHTVLSPHWFTYIQEHMEAH